MHVARVSFLGTKIPFWKGTYLVRSVFLLLEGGISIIWKGRLPPPFPTCHFGGGRCHFKGGGKIQFLRGCSLFFAIFSFFGGARYII